MKNMYIALHHQGFAFSAEAWQNSELAGGVYGIRIGAVFFGESMFSRKTNASKFAFIKLVQHLAQTGVQLIDCQVYTSHVETLGAREIPRKEFVALLERLCI
jgi:leucyl/phenylalanyl-tRNA--protein transferase